MRMLGHNSWQFTASPQSSIMIMIMISLPGARKHASSSSQCNRKLTAVFFLSFFLDTGSTSSQRQVVKKKKKKPLSKPRFPRFNFFFQATLLKHTTVLVLWYGMWMGDHWQSSRRDQAYF
jgi:hypothetical protein